MLTGFADEAGATIEKQIEATKVLGWCNIESRAINGVNIHDMPDADFLACADKLDRAGIQVNCFGSTIANWSKSIKSPFDETLTEIRRAIPRMQRLKTPMIRIMSYAVLKDEKGRDLADQMKEERFRRLRKIVRLFQDAGITAVHENCMNYGGMSYRHTLELLEAVPGLKLVFDTGNPVFTNDRSKPSPHPKQSSWEFYSSIRDHIAYVHIKDGVSIPSPTASGGEESRFTFPGEGNGDVRRIVQDLLAGGYTGGFSIEPHLAVVFHDASVQAPEEIKFANYVEYGRRFMDLLREVNP